jgi:hypothetical protein
MMNSPLSLDGETDMNASIAPHRAGLGTLVLLTAVATASPAAALVIDSFTDPFPAHSSLPATGARVLFVGPLCDGAACPPGTIVTNPDEFSDRTKQFDLPGILGPIRQTSFGTWFEPNPGGSGVLAIDPASGGRLSLASPGGPILGLQLKYGGHENDGDGEHPLNLDLEAEGSDRLEIEILAVPATPYNPLRLFVQLGKNEGRLDALWANHEAQIDAPGLLVIPFAELEGRFEEFKDDVDYIRFEFVMSPSGELVVGEFRFASATTATEPSSWGRIKSAYRR